MNAIESVRFWLHDDGSMPNRQIQELLNMEKVMDSEGRDPSHDDWEPTYDVMRAAGRGWLWRAGLAENKSVHYRVGDVSVTVDKSYCLSRARELMGSKSALVQRRDEAGVDTSPRYKND